MTEYNGGLIDIVKFLFGPCPYSGIQLLKSLYFITSHSDEYLFACLVIKEVANVGGGQKPRNY
jgi:hypothetical protein